MMANESMPQFYGGMIMTISSLRPILERPFRQYAIFSDRSSRTEFWLFLLTFIVLTNIAWMIGFGVMKLAGYESYDHRHDHIATFHEHQSHYEGAPGNSDQTQRFHGTQDSPIIFMLHQHAGEDGYHLHGSIGPFSRYEGKWGRNGDHGDRDSHFSFHLSHDDRTSAKDGAETVQGLVTLALLLPLLAVGARRLHDSGKTGWWQLLVLIPLAGWLVLVIFFLVPSDPKKNRFGAPVT